MKRKGKIDLGTIFVIGMIVMFVAWLVGKVGFWSMVFFPFKFVFGVIGLFFGVILLIVVLALLFIGGMWLCEKFGG